ncbi:hypothetical protein FALBO_11398 [Fusarium albosuccineum]|uniref:Uncharacterized protein n=1 Tax=Fusarium albosuccineum TaxID=1237068 RepID=A0A8H4PHV8_9HYPO|nr:hypothetical protein FALBO_11398 [Fusarium albosuccineum]
MTGKPPNGGQQPPRRSTRKTRGQPSSFLRDNYVLGEAASSAASAPKRKTSVVLDCIYVATDDVDAELEDAVPDFLQQPPMPQKAFASSQQDQQPQDAPQAQERMAPQSIDPLNLGPALEYDFGRETDTNLAQHRRKMNLLYGENQLTCGDPSDPMQLIGEFDEWYEQMQAAGAQNDLDVEMTDIAAHAFVPLAQPLDEDANALAFQPNTSSDAILPPFEDFQEWLVELPDDEGHQNDPDVEMHDTFADS